MPDQLDESNFVRQRLFGNANPKWRQYASFVITDPSVMRLIGYEIRTGLFGSIPGALGLILRRRFLAKLFKSVGTNLVIGRNVTIRHGGNIRLGNNVVLDDGCLIDGRGAGEDGLVIGDNTIVGRHAVVHSKLGRIRIGANCNIGSFSVITAQGGIEIGDWVQIAGNCKLSGGRFKLRRDLDGGVPFTRYSEGPIRIGDYSLLGGSVQITDGVSIGTHCVVGAGAIVMNDVRDNSVFMPRPGMIIGSTLPGDPGSDAPEQ